MKRIILLFFVSILIASCIKDIDDAPSDLRANYLIEEAKTYFEEYVASFDDYSTRSFDDRSIFALDLIPEWNRSVVSEDNSRLSLDIPILETRKLFAKVGENPYFVETPQKLLYVKENATDKQNLHVLTLIPDYEFISKKELTTNYFLHSGEKNDYSGMAIYSLPLTDRVVRIDLYKDGQKIESYGFLGVDEKDEMESEIIDDILLNISFLTQKIEKTRSSNEGGSGGGGGLPPDPTDTDMPDGMQYKDDASKEKLSEDYKAFAKSIFGSKLLELLSQNLGAGKWQITIIHYDYILGLCRTNINTKEISIYLDESEIHWPAPWAEELFHAYQETNVPHRYIENGEMIYLTGNVEIESHMMQIIHNQYAGPGCAGNKGRWIPYNDFINNPTEENFNKVVDAMRKDYYDIDPQGKEFLYDYTRFHRANLDSLIKILPPPPPPKE